MISEIVKQAIEASWDDDTRGYQLPDGEINPSKGQCAVTALLVQDIYGGKLKRGHVGDVSHYWNELPDGTEIDLTRQQFGDDADKLEFDLYREREYVLTASETTRTRYEYLKERFAKNLTYAI